MSHSPLVLALTALGIAITAVALPAGATAPGSNGKLVFERPTRDGADLFTVGADGSGLTRLTRLRGTEGDASWSPDGSHVAFARARDPEDGPYEIWAVNADGSGLKRLTRHRGFSIAPAWSPDGGKIVYATDVGRHPLLRLYVMNADGSDKQRLASSRTRAYVDPSWSPDGATIAFGIGKAAETPGGVDLSIAAVDADDGGNLRRLTRRGGADEVNPNWSPDGTRIAFEQNRFFDLRQSDIWLMNADGSAKRRITATRFYETNPVFSPDGTRVAFTSDRDKPTALEGATRPRLRALHDGARRRRHRRGDHQPPPGPVPGLAAAALMSGDGRRGPASRNVKDSESDERRPG